MSDLQMSPFPVLDPVVACSVTLSLCIKFFVLQTSECSSRHLEGLAGS